MSDQELQQLRENLSFTLEKDVTLQFIVTQLHRIISHLESERDHRVGATTMSAHHQAILYGDPDDTAKPGLIIKVNTMWKWRQWLLGTASAAAGSLLTVAIKHFFP